MRSCVFVPSFPGVSETFITRHALGLNAKVCTRKLRKDLPMPEGVEAVELPPPDDSPNYLKYTWQRRIRSRWRLLRYHNATMMPLNIEKAFRQYLTQNGIDVVLAEYGMTGLYCLKPCAEARTPFVVHFHGYDLSTYYRNRGYRYSLGRLVKKAAGIVVVNDLQKERLIGLGAQEDRIFYIPCGVSLHEFNVSKKVAEQPCHFLAVGRLTGKKAPLLTIRAFTKCAAACDDVDLTMIGTGPLEKECLQLAHELGVDKRVRFLGPQPNSSVVDQMQHSGAFLQHSVTAEDGDEEGWPVSIAEAVASGLPIVSTRHGGIPKQVIEGKTGYLVDEGDWETMAERMIELARNPQQREAMGRAGRCHIEKHGDLDQCIAKLKSVLESVANKSKN